MTQEANHQIQQSQTYQTTTNQQAQKSKQKRTRKTIEQELAELEARKQKLLESKRKSEAHEKIVFGGIIISILKNMKKNNDPNYKIIYDVIVSYYLNESNRNKDIINKVINNL